MLCRVCGREFNPHGFQVVVPGLAQGFDRVECALEASALGLPPTSSGTPLAAVLGPPLPAALPAGHAPVAFAAGEQARPPLLVSANLALLAAGTATTIYLWLRVFGADVAPLSLPLESATAPFSQGTVAAAIDLSPAPEARPQPESAANGGLTGPVATPAAAGPAPAASGGGGGTLVSNPTKPKPSKSKPSGGGGGGGSSQTTAAPVARPVPPPPPPPPPAAPAPRRSAPSPGNPIPIPPPPPGRAPGGGQPDHGPPQMPGAPGNPGGGRG